MNHVRIQGLLFGFFAAVTLAAVGCDDDNEPHDNPTVGGASPAPNPAGGTAHFGGASLQAGGGSSASEAGAAGQGSHSGGDTAGSAGLAGSAGASSIPAPPPVTCTVVSDKTKPITPATGRKVYCAIDLGSNNAKLQTISMEPGLPLTFKNERQCRSKLGFGAIVFDASSQTAKPLPTAQIDNLTTVMNEFKTLCALDGGALLGVDATQWARDVTNLQEVKARVKAATALDIEVLTPEAEGKYGYVAATRNAPEKLALDPGSNSFQLSWWSKGAESPSAVSIPFGYVRGAATYYPANTTDTYAVARQNHETALKSKIDTALGALTPANALAQLKQAVAEGNLARELFLLGQDGATHLAIRGELRDPTTLSWINTVDAFKARVSQEPTQYNPNYGEITTLLLPAELDNFFDTILTPEAFLALRTEPIRSIYGQSTLPNAALFELLIKELDITTVVSVPQEMPAGFILAKAEAR